MGAYVLVHHDTEITELLLETNIKKLETNVCWPYPSPSTPFFYVPKISLDYHYHGPINNGWLFEFSCRHVECCLWRGGLSGDWWFHFVKWHVLVGTECNLCHLILYHRNRDKIHARVYYKYSWNIISSTIWFVNVFLNVYCTCCIYAYWKPE